MVEMFLSVDYDVSRCISVDWIDNCHSYAMYYSQMSDSDSETEESPVVCIGYCGNECPDKATSNSSRFQVMHSRCWNCTVQLSIPQESSDDEEDAGEISQQQPQQSQQQIQSFCG
jgi:hypothetical protein